MIIAVEKDSRRTHRVKMRERHTKMKFVCQVDVMERLHGCIDRCNYVFSDSIIDGMWAIKARGAYLCNSRIYESITLGFEDCSYESMRFIDWKGFGRVIAMPLKMFVGRCICRE